MKQIIEFKLHGSEVPHFVGSTLPIQPIGGRRYGISVDTTDSYLPDTVRIMTSDELTRVVVLSEMSKPVETGKQDGFGEPTIEHVPMTEEEKISYVNEWLTGVGYRGN